MPQGELWNLLAKKLSGEATGEELAALDRLLLLHPDWLYTVEQVQKEWSASAALHPDPDSSLAFSQHLAYLRAQGLSLPLPDGEGELEPEGDGSGLIKKRLILVAVFLIAICGVLLLTGKGLETTKKPDAPLSEVATRPGSRTRLVLADSSIVWLNAGSRLTYDNRFGQDHRQVSLTGEAFFDVKKSSIPFVIHTRTVKIKVMGTAFNVRAYDNDATTETSLIRGQVEVTINRRPGAPFVLKPNEKLVVANARPVQDTSLPAASGGELVTLSTLKPFAPQVLPETSWVDSKLVFRDETFEEVARKLERWYGVTINILAPDLKGVRLTGVFEKESLQEALQALQIIEPFAFTTNGANITINESHDEPF